MADKNIKDIEVDDEEVETSGVQHRIDKLTAQKKAAQEELENLKKQVQEMTNKKLEEEGKYKELNEKLSKDLKERTRELNATRALHKLEKEFDTEIPDTLAARLQGETEEELIKDAKSFLPMLSKKSSDKTDNTAKTDDKKSDVVTTPVAEQKVERGNLKPAPVNTSPAQAKPKTAREILAAGKPW